MSVSRYRPGRGRTRRLAAVGVLAVGIAALVIALSLDSGRSSRVGSGRSSRAATHPAHTSKPARPFLGPGYYRAFAHGPSASQDFFPIYTYQPHLGQWSELPARVVAMGVNGVDDAFGPPPSGDYELGLAHGLRFNVMSAHPTSPQAASSYAMADEPNQTGSPYAASSCTPAADHCAAAYAAVAHSRRSADPSRPVWGNFTKDVDEWTFAPPGWTAAQFQHHLRTMLNALDIASADDYGWTDTVEFNQATGRGTGHYGAWVYGHAIERLGELNPRIPAYGFVECCDSTDGNGTTKPTNEMMPGMLQAAVWNIIVHGGRGLVYWTKNFWDSSPGGDPYADAYPGATYTGDYALYAEHQWDPQYAAARQADHAIRAAAPELNAPTISGASATDARGVPVATLAKKRAGKLWLLAQADGDSAHPLSNTSPMTANIAVPSSAAPGTVLEVLGEHRTVTVDAHHQVTDTFGTKTETPFSGRSITYGYQHHIYVMR